MTADDRKNTLSRIRSSFMWQPSKYGSSEGVADIQFLLSELDLRDEALRRASKTLDQLGFMEKEGEKVSVSYEAWSDAMAMRDEIDTDFPAREVLGEE